MRSPSAIAVPSSAEAPADSAARGLARRAAFADFKELLKPGITTFVVVMAAAGYVVAAEGPIDWAVLAGLMVGTALTAGGAAALNHVAERKYDAQMARTAARPLPTGRVSAAAAAAYGAACAALGAVVLAATTNAVTTGLALLTVVLYVAVYTPMKRRTAWNTLVGAVPGALPALGGAAAASGQVDATGWSLFAVLFLWQLPHFFALAWMYREDYRQAGFRMLPSVRGGERITAWLVLVSTLLLLVAGVVPAALDKAGPLYLAGMGLLGTAFTLPAFSFFSDPNDTRARRLLLASIAYVPAFFGLVVLDFLLR
jgi:protoheme IX farnesyltransferase